MRPRPAGAALLLNALAPCDWSAQGRKEWERALLDNVAASAKQPPAVLTYYYYLDLGVCFGGEWKVSGLVSCRFPLLSESKQLAYPHTRDADVR
jgi:hypothetical protein